MTTSSKIQSQHLSRMAMVYIRQSTMTQVRFHRESTERQYALKDKAKDLGWNEEQIQVIDEDLGISGAHKSNRQGFQRLVGQVSLGQVGAIFGLEISRLARSSADLLHLLEICALFDTIVIDEDGVYDLNDFNDRLILGFKGTMSEAELHFLRARMLGGKRNKAHKGELRFPLPIGYCFDPDGKIVLDPDESVQTAVRHVFEQFQTAGTAYGVVKFFAQHQLSFPKRAYGGSWAGKLVWGSLTHGRVLGVLKNPSYAGAYVFGRYKSRKSIDTTGMFHSHTVRLPQKQWEVLLFDHHPGYITWTQYEDNQRQLEQNQTNTEVSGPPREGICLLQGLLVCGRCGERMTVRYKGNGGISPQYECHRRWVNDQIPFCSTVPASPLDEAITQRIMEILQPGELELVLLSMDRVRVHEGQIDQSWRLTLEHAQYEADRAQRQYELAEPENRLVVRSLESKWNEKLVTLQQLQEDYAQNQARCSWCPTDEDRQAILSLAQDVPRIWQAPTTTMPDRKRIVRLLIEDITVWAEPRKPDVRLGIRWHSQYCEELHVTKKLPNSMVRKHPPETVELVRQLSHELTIHEITCFLNESKIRTPEGRQFTDHGVQWLRYLYHITGPDHKPGEMTLKEVAAHFDVGPHVIYYWLECGILHGSKRGPGYPWIIQLDEKTERELHQRAETSTKIQIARHKRRA